MSKIYEFDLSTRKYVEREIPDAFHAGSEGQVVCEAVQPDDTQSSGAMDKSTENDLRDMGLLLPDGSIDYETLMTLPPIETVCAPPPVDNPAIDMTPGAVRRKVENTLAGQYRCIAYLALSRGGKGYRGTGFVMGPNLVVTAMHCLCDRKTLEFNDAVYVIPARTEKTSPLPTFKAKKIVINPEFINDPNTQYVCGRDWGMVLVEGNIQQVTGSLGSMIVYTGLTGQIVELPGYSAIAPNGKTSLDMWTSEGKIDKYSDTPYFNALHHNADHWGGSSGAPIIYDFGNKNYMVAIHASATIDGKYCFSCGFTWTIANLVDYYRKAGSKE